MSRKKVLLLGDYTHPMYHPLQGVDAEVSRILQDEMTVQCSENRNLMLMENLAGYDLLISYLDDWKGAIAPQQAAGLLSYVSGGGALLVLHNGISMHNRYEIAQLLGGRFTGHPAPRELRFQVTDPLHPIVSGIDNFSMEEEPYEIEFDNFADITVLLEYMNEDGKSWPAAWAHNYGMGRVVYLMPGHSVPSFNNESFRRLLLQSAMWATRTKPKRN
ncbi:ThuA domain-containing protein [Paenibacillus sp. Marseille-Q7038]